MDNQQLAPLVVSAKNGNSAAMNTLFTECYNDVYFFLLKTVKSEPLASDITQETFLKAFTSLDTLNDELAFPSWILQIAYRKAMQYFRKKTEVLVEEDEDGNSVFDILQEDNSEFIPDEALNNAEFKKTILGMIDSLSEEQRTAILLYYFEEYSVKQIAMIQGVSEGTVKSRLNYSHKAIRTSVEEYETKHNIKLHAIPILPFLRWLYSEEKKKKDPVALLGNMASAITAITGAAATVGSTAASTATTVTTTVAASAAAGGIFSKLASIPTAIKIISATVAASVVVGGAATTVSVNHHEKEAGASASGSEADILINSEDTTLDVLTESSEHTEQIIDSQHQVNPDSVSDFTQRTDTSSVTVQVVPKDEKKSENTTKSPTTRQTEAREVVADTTISPGTTVSETTTGRQTTSVSDTTAIPSTETTDSETKATETTASQTTAQDTTSAPETTSKVQGASAEDFSYTSSNYGGIKLTKYKGKKSTMIIPETINGQPVVEIGSSFCYWNSSVKKVIMPDTIVYIGDSAFCRTDCLTEVIWSERLKQIGPSAFYDCGFSSIVLPDSVTYLDNCSFGGCKKLTFQFGNFKLVSVKTRKGIFNGFVRTPC